MQISGHIWRAVFSKTSIGIFVLALILRVLHIWQIHRSPFAMLMGDAVSYDSWAHEISSGNWIGSEVFYQAPFYPYFLAAIYLFSDNPLVVRMCQAIIGAVSCVLLADAGRRLFSRPVGIVAGIGLALYAPALFFDGLIQKATVSLWLLCMLLWILSRIIAKPRRSMCVWSGVVMGCLALARENSLVLVVPILIWLIVHHRKLGKQGFILAGMFVLGMAVVLFPVALRNQIVGGEFHLTTSQFGPNLYYGNHERATGVYQALHTARGDARHERKDATETAERALGRKLTPQEVSAYWIGRVLDYVISQPGHWLKLMARKFALLWNATEIMDTEDQYTHADWSIPLRLSGYIFHFGVVTPLAAVGLVLTWPQRRQLWLLYLLLGCYAASVVIFYVYGRYRFPLVPFLVLFAAAGVVQLPHLLRSISVLKASVLVGVGVVVAVFCNWPMIPRSQMRATTYHNLADTFASMNRSQEAIKYSRKALQISPDFAGAHFMLGVNLGKTGELEEGRLHLQKAVKLDPEFADAHFGLATAYKLKGEFDESIRHYRRGLEIRPHADAYINLGNILADRKEYDEASSLYRKALALNPESANAHYRWGLTLDEQGVQDKAISHYESALQIDPDHAGAYEQIAYRLLAQGKVNEATNHLQQALLQSSGSAALHYNLGNAMLSQGKTDQAIHHYREALQIAPDSPEAHNNLANALQSQKRLDEAVHHYNEALRLNPDHVAAHINLAVTLLEMGEHGDAIAHYHRALQIRGDDPGLHNRLAHALTAAGNHDEAIIHYRKVLERQGDNVVAHFNLGNLLRAQGRWNEALVSYREAMRLKSDWPAPLNGAAWILATHPDPDTRSPDEAVRLAEKAASLTKNQNPAVLDTLAVSYAAAGKFDQAVDTAQLALEQMAQIGSQELIEPLRTRLELYQQGQPYVAE